MKKPSIGQWNKFIKNSHSPSIVKEYPLGNENSLVVEIKKNIGVVNRLIMIENIVDWLFVGDEHQAGLYTPIFWYFVLSNHTNLPIGSLTKEPSENEDGGGIINVKTLDDILTIVENTNIVEDVEIAIGRANFETLKDEVDRTIEYRKQMTIQQNSAFNKIMESLSSIVDSVAASAEKFEGFDLNSLKTALNKIDSLGGKDIVQTLIK